MKITSYILFDHNGINQTSTGRKLYNIHKHNAEWWGDWEVNIKVPRIEWTWEYNIPESNESNLGADL